MIRRLALTAVLALATWLVVKSLPDIERYMRIRSM